MKMAKASEKDIEAAIAVMGILDAINHGFYPVDPDAQGIETPTFFDPDDKHHLRHLYDLLIRHAKHPPGGILRVVMGFSTIMSNNVVDPDKDHLELHPRLLAGLAAVEAQAAKRYEVRVAGPDDVHQFSSEILALREANKINRLHVDDCLKHPNDHVLCVAVVHPVEAPAAAPVPA